MSIKRKLLRLLRTWLERRIRKQTKLTVAAERKAIIKKPTGFAYTLEDPMTLLCARNICYSYFAEHNRWPTIKSTKEQFAKAGIPNMCGGYLNMVLWGAAKGIDKDPHFVKLLGKKTHLNLELIRPLKKH